MADQWDQHLGGVLAPLLDAEGEERKNHRSTNEMAVKTAPEQGGPRNIKNKLVKRRHSVVPPHSRFPTTAPTPQTLYVLKAAKMAAVRHRPGCRFRPRSSSFRLTA
jgi:hypothetical protein